MIDNQNRRQTLDDVFDAFSVLAGGNYISLYDIKGHLTRYSPGAVELFGLPGEYIKDGAYDWSDYVHPEDRKRYNDTMGELLDGKTLSYDITYRVHLASGDYGIFRFIGSVMRTDDGVPSLVGGMMVNEGMLENTDSITILRNQYGFLIDLADMFIQKKDARILILGINKMSDINRASGYGYGNIVLQQTGWILRELVGTAGKVYRLDGAKFGIFSDSMTERSMSQLYERIKNRLQGGSISIDDKKISISISGGLLSLKDTHINESTVYFCLKHILRESRERMYGKLVNYSGTSDYDANTSLEMFNEIRNCVFDDCKGFEVFYQPLFGNDEHEKIVGAEALIRWKSEDGKTVLPMEFLPVLERDFAFEELGEFVLERAMTDIRGLVEQYPDFHLGINVSPVQLTSVDFEDDIFRMLKRTGFPAKNLYIELTKACRMIDTERLQDVIRNLHAHGIRIVIDDFGSGNDSIGFLKVSDSDYVKLDTSLTANIVDSEEERLILKNLSEIAGAYGASVCIKGIETEEMKQIVRQYPVKSMQGYYFSEPVTIEAFKKKLK